MKRTVSIILLLALMLSILTACGGSNTGTTAKEFKWSEIELHDHLPEPDRVYGDWSRNSEEGLTLTLCEVDKNAFNNYKEDCISKGYDIDEEETTTTYSAFDKDGYYIGLVFSDYSQEISITLDTPEEMAEFEWPTSGLGAMLPSTKSTLGNISWDNSKTFIVHIGNTTIEDYKEYVKSCEGKGFTVDYSRSDKYYSAKNSNGYELTLRYLGFNRIEIALNAPDEEDITEKIPSTATPSANVGDLDPDFKAAMDKYEEFMNDYVDFMKKYKANPSDLGLLSEYADFMSDYADYVEDFSDWEDEDLNDAELAYYIDVQTRVNKKLLEVAQ